MSVSLVFGEQYGRKHKETHYTKTISKNGSFRPTVQSCATDYDWVCQLFPERGSLQPGSCRLFCAVCCCWEWGVVGGENAVVLYCYRLYQ